ncbi:MAG: hypothetical protein MJ077_01410 [Oscillospiraceae bacterium]|nr:hypothetical protein [Oscillospiraceae bacterium]
MNEYQFWLIVVVLVTLAVLILFPVIKKYLQDRDFKRQVEGKQPMREMKEPSRTEDPKLNAELEAERARMVGNIRRDATGIGK